MEPFILKKIFLTNQKTIAIIPLVKNVKRKNFVLHKKQTLPLSGSEAERTAGSIADAGYKLATQLSLYLFDCVKSAISQVDSKEDPC